MLLHRPDGIRGDTQFRAFLAGMDEANHFPDGVSEINSAAISDINAERDAALIGDNAITAGEFATHRVAAAAIDYGDFVSVDLFGGEERPIVKASRVANFLMCGIEPLQHFGFIM